MGRWQAPGPRGDPAWLGPQLQVGKLQRPSSLVRWGGDGADPGVKELVKGPRRRLVGIKHVASAGRFVKLPQAPLGTEGPPTGQVSPGQSWGKGPDTAPSCVSPNQPPRSPFSGPPPSIPEGGRAEPTLSTRRLREAGGSRRCCAEVHCLCCPACSLSCFRWPAIVLGRS